VHCLSDNELLLFYLTPHLEFLGFPDSFLSNEQCKFPSITYREIIIYIKSVLVYLVWYSYKKNVTFGALCAKDLNYILCSTDTSFHY